MPVTIKTIVAYACYIEEPAHGFRFRWAFSKVYSEECRLRDEQNFVGSFYLYAALLYAASPNLNFVTNSSQLEVLLGEIIESKKPEAANIFFSNKILSENKNLFPGIEELSKSLAELNHLYEGPDIILDEFDWGLKVLTPKEAAIFWSSSLSSDTERELAEESKIVTRVHDIFYKNFDNEKILPLIEDLALTAPDSFSMLTIQDYAYKIISRHSNDVPNEICKHLLKYIGKDKRRVAKRILKEF